MPTQLVSPSIPSSEPQVPTANVPNMEPKATPIKRSIFLMIPPGGQQWEGMRSWGHQDSLTRGFPKAMVNQWSEEKTVWWMASTNYMAKVWSHHKLQGSSRPEVSSRFGPYQNREISRAMRHLKDMSYNVIHISKKNTGIHQRRVHVIETWPWHTVRYSLTCTVIPLSL